MRCEQLADVLSQAADGGGAAAIADRHARSHVEHCLHCQAELAQYRRLLREMGGLRAEVVDPGHDLLEEVLAAVAAAESPHAIRAMLSRRRAAYLGGLAAATAAGAAGALVLTARSGRGRPAR